MFSKMRPAETAKSERERIRAALVALVAERDYPAVTLEAVLDRAGLDRDAFERHYSSLDQCFEAAWNQCKDEVVARTSSAFWAEARWRDGMRAAAWAFCRWIVENHDSARLMLVQMNYAGGLLTAVRDRVLDSHIEMIDQGNRERTKPEPIPRAQAEGIMGGIWDTAARMVNHGSFDQLPSAIPQAMYLTVLPYLGSEAAQEELRRGPEDIARYQRGEL